MAEVEAVDGAAVGARDDAGVDVGAVAVTLMPMQVVPLHRLKGMML